MAGYSRVVPPLGALNVANPAQENAQNDAHGHGHEQTQNNHGNKTSHAHDDSRSIGRKQRESGGKDEG